MSRQPDQWRELCIAAAFEEKPERLAEIVEEIKKSLVERQQELADRIFEKLAGQPLAEADQKRWIQ